MKRNLAIFASGSGTNAENLIEYFNHSKEVQVSLILTNKPDAYVIKRARKLNVPAFTFTRNELSNSETVHEVLTKHKIDIIVLAGFLLLMPESLVRSYPNMIINIHPALLPAYGGKGMYGRYVHESVIANGEKESGITVHLVDEVYDRGQILLQKTCSIGKEDTVDSLAQKVHDLEYKYFPTVVESYIRSKFE